MSTVIGELLNGVNPREPAVYIAATAVLLSVTLVATHLHAAPHAAGRSTSGIAL